MCDSCGWQSSLADAEVGLAADPNEWLQNVVAWMRKNQHVTTRMAFKIAQSYGRCVVCGKPGHRVVGRDAYCGSHVDIAKDARAGISHWINDKADKESAAVMAQSKARTEARKFASWREEKIRRYEASVEHIQDPATRLRGDKS